eukprot:240304_1
MINQQSPTPSLADINENILAMGGQRPKMNINIGAGLIDSGHGPYEKTLKVEDKYGHLEDLSSKEIGDAIVATKDMKDIFVNVNVQYVKYIFVHIIMVYQSISNTNININIKKC